MRGWIVLLMVIGFVSGVDINFNCPDEVFVDEEFECSLEILDGDGEYDVKVAFDEERDSVGQIWDGDVWKSGYYYLIEFIEDDEEDVRLKISEAGDYDGVVKLRQGDVREVFEFEIEAMRPEVAVDSGKLEVDSEGVILNPEVIVLGGAAVVEVDDVVYESKDARVVDFLPYGFSLFLVLIIVVLIWERR